MLNRQYDRMILESVEHGPLLWSSVTEDGVTRLKKYFELSSAEATQADCDIKATNIILQSLPPEIYALFILSPTLISATSINISVFTIYNIISHSLVCLTRIIIIKSLNLLSLNDTSSTINHNAYIASAPQIDYAPIAHHPSEFSSPDTGLVVLVFQKGDDPIDAINHMMSFLTSVVTLR
nr:hypothetical protein [Tanacetum cinerariifolium]